MRFTRLGIARMFRAWPYLRAVVAVFDRDFYLHKYPDVAAAGVNPLQHYLEHGAEEGRKPHPLFDHDFYLLCCPEARDAVEPSILHFLKQAVPRGNPHPLFDCESYLRAHPQAAMQKINPLVHYVRNPPAEADALRGLTEVRQGSLPHSRGSEAIIDVEGLTEPRASASGSGGEPRLKPALPFVRLEIRDAAVTIVLGEPEAGSAGDLVYVWEDSEGNTRFLAPAEQRRFFGAVKYDQLRAQAQ
ncbi:MAG TPA: hypothetical protein VIY49_07695 [Bryobacteraceae bacterium]